MPRLAVVLAVAVLLSTGCASTTLDESAPVASGGETTTTAPAPEGVTATLEELLALTLDLGDRIVEGGSADDLTLARIQALWAAIGEQVEDTDPATFRNLDREFTRLVKAVGRVRPADADKAARDLGVLIPAFLAEHSPG